MNQGQENARVVGIDVAKATLDVGVLPERQHWQVANDEDGWASLVTAWQESPPRLIVLEATGGYEVGIVLALDAVGLTPVVANPMATRRFAQSLGMRGKTDRIDAAVRAQYGQQVRPSPKPVPGETARQLRALLARRTQVTGLIVMESNRLHQADPVVRPSVQAVLDALRTAQSTTDALIASVVASDPTWSTRIDHLQTVPGIGPLTATILTVCLPELGSTHGKSLASLVGVAPHPRDSGRRHGRRHISGGRSTVRRALYQVVHSARLSRDPIIRSHFTQLRGRGKTHKQAMVACMRRLLGILNAMVRDGLTWHQTAVGQRHFLSPQLDS